MFSTYVLSDFALIELSKRPYFRGSENVAADNFTSMQSMPDGHPRFLLELLVAHLSDLRQKQQSKIFVCMHESSQL